MAKPIKRKHAKAFEKFIDEIMGKRKKKASLSMDQIDDFIENTLGEDSKNWSWSDNPEKNKYSVYELMTNVAVQFEIMPTFEITREFVRDE
jgi:hypothetical protein